MRKLLRSRATGKIRRAVLGRGTPASRNGSLERREIESLNHFMPKYNLSCFDSNLQHTKFNMFDATGANCGRLTILTEDVVNFLTNNWKGNIDWNGMIPDVVLNYSK